MENALDISEYAGETKTRALTLCYNVTFSHFQITWYDNELKETIEGGVQTVSELMADGKRFKTISVLRFTADLEHNGRNITCQAQNSADSQPHTRSIR